MNLVHNERIKLTASSLNNLSAVLIVGGFALPSFGFLCGPQGLATGPWQFFISAGSVLCGIGLHLAASAVLKKLRP
jgi:hypothetical protein